MYIKGDAYSADNLTAEALKGLQKGDSVSIGVTSVSGEEFVVDVKITATDVSDVLVRVEGFTTHNGARGNVAALLFIDEKLGEGAIELTFY